MLLKSYDARLNAALARRNKSLHAVRFEFTEQKRLLSEKAAGTRYRVMHWLGLPVPGEGAEAAAQASRSEGLPGAVRRHPLLWLAGAAALGLSCAAAVWRVRSKKRERQPSLKQKEPAAARSTPGRFETVFNSFMPVLMDIFRQRVSAPHTNGPVRPAEKAGTVS